MMDIAYIYIYSRGLKVFFSCPCVLYTKQTKLQTRKIENKTRFPVSSKTLFASPFCTGKAEIALVPVLLPHHTLREERTAGFIAQPSPTLLKRIILGLFARNSLLHQAFTRILISVVDRRVGEREESLQSWQTL